MTAQSWSRIEGLKSKRFGLCGIHHFPHVDAHAIEQHFQFIHHRDVDSAIGVFQDLAGFGNFGIVDAHNLHDRVTIKSTRQITAQRINPTDHLWNSGGSVIRIAWIFAFRTECHEDIFTTDEFGRIAIQDGHHHISSCRRISGAFQNDELTGSHNGRDRFGS